MRRSAEKTRLAQARVIAGVSLETLAEYLRVSANHLRHVERGARPLPPDMAFFLGEALGVSPHWLMGFGDSKGPVDFRGNPYTVESFKAAKGRKDSRERGEAWRIYLQDRLARAFKAAADRNDSDLLGCRIEDVIEGTLASAGQAARSELGSVDDVLRRMRQAGENAPKPDPEASPQLPQGPGAPRKRNAGASPRNRAR
jgi:transcriptional regulator with XRE-family HTH domain